MPGATLKGLNKLLISAGASLLAACGGGSGAGGDEPQWQAGVYQAPDSYKSLCQAPRAGVSAITGQAYDDQPGSTQAENLWLRSWINDSYLWFDEVPDLNPAGYTTDDYFAELKTPAITASGKAKDQFHFSIPTTDWEAQSQAGISVNYGVDFAVLSPSVPRAVVVALTNPGSVAELAGVARGDRIVSIDGTDINDTTTAGVDTLNAGLNPSDIGEEHTFVLRAVDNSVNTITLQANSQAETPVQSVQIIDTDSGPVGYLLFTRHNYPSEALLVAAFEQFASASVTDVVLDLRYNGGGFLAIASQVAYMVANKSLTNSAVFEQLQFNSKYPNRNPVTGESNDPVPFFDTSLGFSLSSGQALPNLGLMRLYVIATGDTCSASESIINSLRGVGVEVILIGSATCGKPYGFYPEDNCGTTYFSVQFQSVNDAGFGDYADGFSPAGQAPVGAVELPGCYLDDDYQHAIGDTTEAMLATALSYRASGQCPTSPVTAKVSAPRQTSPRLIRSTWESNRILTPRGEL
ncbi:S41 family peptidase [Halioxenophilus sp. WMMB6]|uniref:S41 family peptidase n=1 Tax=Halioxenophilus sp. WMMB6 TaxID=3073815 RepID=UPI00295EFBF1|nr:S41 family peptidase [Halioxenophilus sp. WMMB6]